MIKKNYNKINSYLMSDMYSQEMKKILEIIDHL